MINYLNIRKAWLSLCFFLLSLYSVAQSDKSIVKAELEKSVEAVEKMIELAWEYEYVNIDSSIFFANKALKLSQNLKYKKGEADSYKVLGNLNTNLARYVVALDHHENSNRIYREIKDADGIGRSTVNLGTVHQGMGNFDLALTNFTKALGYFREVGDSTVIAVIHFNIGNTFGYQKELSRSEEHYQKALQIFKTLGNESMIGRCHESLGIVYTYQKKYKKGLMHLDRALEISNNEQNPERIASVNINLGFLFEEKKDYIKAIEYYGKSLKIADEIQSTQDEMISMLNLSACYAEINDFVKSEKMYTTVIELAQLSAAKRELSYAHLGLSELYEKMGKSDLALTQFRLHSQWNDSLLNEERIHTIEELNSKYELEERDHQIVLLAEQKKTTKEKSDKEKAWLIGAIGFLFLLGVIALVYIKNRKLRSKRKQQELEQKVLRSQMNPHFVFNSLNSIQDMYMSGEHDLANEYMGDFGELMRKILDNSGAEKISLKEELKTLELYLSLEKTRVGEFLEYSIVVDEEVDLLNTEVSPLIIQPIVENAIWHGILPKKSSGFVSVKITFEEDSLVCIVEDDGVGYNKPTTSHDSKGMGITEQRLGRKIIVEHLEPGTRITLILAN